MYSAFEDISTLPTGIWKGSVAAFITESQSNSGGWPNEYDWFYEIKQQL